MARPDSAPRSIASALPSRAAACAGGIRGCYPVFSTSMAGGVPDRIGSYELGPEIGRGGMGVVHRARDSRLGRDVAIKMLPLDLARDPLRLERFEREARLLASLSHANIASIFTRNASR